MQIYVDVKYSVFNLEQKSRKNHWACSKYEFSGKNVKKMSLDKGELIKEIKNLIKQDSGMPDFENLGLKKIHYFRNELNSKKCKLQKPLTYDVTKEIFFDSENKKVDFFHVVFCSK